MSYYDDDYSDYNGDHDHDMMVDYDYNQNTGELSEYFDEDYEEESDDLE